MRPINLDYKVRFCLKTKQQQQNPMNRQQAKNSNENQTRPPNRIFSPDKWGKNGTSSVKLGQVRNLSGAWQSSTVATVSAFIIGADLQCRQALRKCSLKDPVEDGEPCRSLC